jgi:hypothetical protein
VPIVKVTGLGALEAFGVVDSMDDRYEHVDIVDTR